MQLALQHEIRNGSRFAAMAMTLLISALGVPLAAAQSSPMESADDSLLPPEVVPLDPQAASSLSATQAANRMQAGGSIEGAAVTPAGSASNPAVPGLVPPTGGNNNSMSAQDFRKAAFNSLYNQGQMPQMQSGGVNYTSGMNPTVPNATGMSPMINPALQAPYSPSMVSNAQPAQSQTLSGGVKRQPKVHDIRRGGITNTASGLAAFAGGMLTATYMMRPQALWGLGMYGLAGTGFGTRNGFRF